MTPPITREEREAEPWYDLEGALVDLEAGRNDAVCHRTVERACKRLYAYEIALKAAEEEIERLQGASALEGRLITALDERNMFINPDMFDQAADEIDCGGSCEKIWWEGDTGASGCSASDKGEYCPNDVAETLRAVGKVARAALSPATGGE